MTKRVIRDLHRTTLRKCTEAELKDLQKNLTWFINYAIRAEVQPFFAKAAWRRLMRVGKELGSRQ